MPESVSSCRSLLHHDARGTGAELGVGEGQRVLAAAEGAFECRERLVVGRLDDRLEVPQERADGDVVVERFGGAVDQRRVGRVCDGVDWIGRLVVFGLVHSVGFSGGRGGFRIGESGEDLLVELAGRFRFLAAGGLAAFVDVLGVAGRAPCLLDVFRDHGHDGVIGHAPLARTVVVQYVTETQPALLHRKTHSPDISV